jgi:hypothetical protein
MVEIEEIILRDIFPRFIQKVRGEVDNMRARKLALWWLHLNELKSPADLFTFPAFINEAESRLHAYLATILMIVFLLVGWFTPYWQCYYLVLYGYTTRVIAGPRFCPSAWLVLFVLYPIANKYKIFQNEMVPSSPKRFAQAIGIVFSLLYVVLMNYCPLAARIISVINITVSLLAASTGYCIGCHLHHFLLSLKYRSASLSPSNLAPVSQSSKQQPGIQSGKVCGFSQRSITPEWNGDCGTGAGTPGTATAAVTIRSPAAAVAAIPRAVSSSMRIVLGLNNGEQGLTNELRLTEPCPQELCLTEQHLIEHEDVSMLGFVDRSRSRRVEHGLIIDDDKEEEDDYDEEELISAAEAIRSVSLPQNIDSIV